MKHILAVTALTVALAGTASSVAAAACGNTSSGFNTWKAAFASEAKRAGVGQRGLQALANSKYASKTIAADRNQKSFKYTLDKFMKVRGAPTIVAQGRKRKAKNATFFNALERQYGVPACRRSAFFVPHAIGALRLVDMGAIDGNTKGAKHGELGHTQFLPGNALKYGIDANGDGRVNFYSEADALASTANFLRQKGWKPGAGYQEGQTNFKVIKQWNAAGVYQKAIAIMGAQIDG